MLALLYCNFNIDRLILLYIKCALRAQTIFSTNKNYLSDITHLLDDASLPACSHLLSASCIQCVRQSIFTSALERLFINVHVVYKRY